MHIIVKKKFWLRSKLETTVIKFCITNHFLAEFNVTLIIIALHKKIFYQINQACFEIEHNNFKEAMIIYKKAVVQLMEFFKLN